MNYLSHWLLIWKKDKGRGGGGGGEVGGVKGTGIGNEKIKKEAGKEEETFQFG